MRAPSRPLDESLPIEVALVPSHSPFAAAVKEAALAAGAEFMRTDLGNAADVH